MRCPCGLGLSYDDCCGRLHRGETTAGTAEQLMRSRFSAFAVGDEPYLLRSWHPSTRPPSVDMTGVRWLRLEVVGSFGGHLLDREGNVEFVATHDGGALHEVSRFVRLDGNWVYVGPVD